MSDAFSRPSLISVSWALDTSDSFSRACFTICITDDCLFLGFKRRTKKVGAFPSDQSLLRLVVTIMMDINEEWITGRKYMSLEVD